MITWLIQSISDCPTLGRGEAPPGLLSAAETARLAQLTLEKRRRDWLLGRWTAKQLVQAYLERETGVSLPLHAIEITNDADGSPRLEIEDWRLEIGEDSGCRSKRFLTTVTPAESPLAPLEKGGTRLWDAGSPPLEGGLGGFGPTKKHQQTAVPADAENPQSPISNLQLSISHSHEHAFCALCGRPGLHVGADIERVETRPPGFAADYFTRDELSLLTAAPPAQHDTLVTAIWSAKEAALKAVRRGLTVDTRQVSCSITSPTSQEWNNVSLTLAPELLPAPVAAYAAPPPSDSWPTTAPTSSGWWRTWGEFVLTMVVVKAA